MAATAMSQPLTRSFPAAAPESQQPAAVASQATLWQPSVRDSAVQKNTWFVLDSLVKCRLSQVRPSFQLYCTSVTSASSLAITMMPPWSPNS